MDSMDRKSIRKERRPRTIQACNLCRTKKYKCDGALPCSNCKRLQKDCAFSAAPDAATANISIAYVKQLERKLEAAEAQLKDYHQRDSLQDVTTPESMPKTTPQANVPILLPTCDATQQASTTPDPVYLVESSRPMLELLPEVMDINTITKRFEFHGTSSIITALDRLVQLRSDMITKSPTSDITLAAQFISSVTEFQNDSFMLKAHKPVLLSMSFGEDEFFSQYAPMFIDTYFMGLHYIHPMIDQGFFIKRCQDLWNGETSRLRASFRLQYYGILALGSATRSWHEGPINGLSQLEWTQLFISKAEQTMTEVEYQTDFEGAQAMFLLAQVHLHFLSYNTAYTSLGNAIRIAHSGSCHRQMRQEDSKVPVDSPTFIISRVWWSLYSQEAELSFLLGRPDGLGDEAFFTRQLPPVSHGSEVNFIPALHSISKALRDIAANLYHGSGDLQFMLTKASEIDGRLDLALKQASSYIQDFNVSGTQNVAAMDTGDSFWVPWQMCLLRIRHLHAKVALFYPFFLHCEQTEQVCADDPFIAFAASKCTEASRQLIREIFRAYKTHMLQRTWSYYSAYMIRALAVVLTNLTRTAGMLNQTSQDRDAVIQALHVLDVLNSNAVPRRIANFTREYLNLLARSIPGAPLSPVKDRNPWIPPPVGHIPNGVSFPPPFPIHVGNFNDHLHHLQTPAPSFEPPTTNAFTMVGTHPLAQPPTFLTSNLPYHPNLT